MKPLQSSRSLHKPSEDHDGFYLHATHTYHDLPPRYWKKYQYASLFVSLVRSKTPKVTLYSEQAKCMMMENGPSPDFEACFYNGKEREGERAKYQVCSIISQLSYLSLPFSSVRS